jgi:hypothetical protein
MAHQNANAVPSDQQIETQRKLTKMLEIGAIICFIFIEKLFRWLLSLSLLFLLLRIL